MLFCGKLPLMLLMGLELGVGIRVCFVRFCDTFCVVLARAWLRCCEKRRYLRELDGKHTSGAEARFDAARLVPEINLRPTLFNAFS